LFPHTSVLRGVVSARAKLGVGRRVAASLKI
jgi:hypothetical protein